MTKNTRYHVFKHKIIIDGLISVKNMKHEFTYIPDLKTDREKNLSSYTDVPRLKTTIVTRYTIHYLNHQLTNTKP